MEASNINFTISHSISMPDSSNTISTVGNTVAATELAKVAPGDTTRKKDLGHSKDQKIDASLQVEYIQAVDKIRQEMLSISRSNRFVRSRGSMMTDSEGKIYAPEDKADKGVLVWIESVRKKIYDIAKEYKKPPREVLQQSQILAKQTLDRDKRLASNVQNMSSSSSTPALSSNDVKEDKNHDDVVIVAEMIKLNDRQTSTSASSLRRLRLSSEVPINTDSCHSHSVSQLSNIEQIIACIDQKISHLRTCIADIQMGTSILEAAAAHELMPEMVQYEVEHECNLGEITFSEFQNLSLQPLRCLQYPVRLQEPDYWARLQTAVLAAAKKPLDTCLETAKEHSIGLFHLLAALKEGFKKGRSRIKKEGKEPTLMQPSPTNPSPGAKSVLMEKQTEPPNPPISVPPIPNSSDTLYHSTNRKRDIRGVEVNSNCGIDRIAKVLSISKSVTDTSHIPISATPNQVGTSNLNANDVSHKQPLKVSKIDTERVSKGESDDEIMVIDEKCHKNKTSLDNRITKHEQGSNVDNKTLQMVCAVCQRSFQKWKEYQSHVLSVCLDYDVL